MAREPEAQELEQAEWLEPAEKRFQRRALVRGHPQAPWGRLQARARQLLP